jgi:hypothetical protein
MTGSVRSVEVHPPSRRGEALVLLRALAVIAFGALAVIALRSGGGATVRAICSRSSASSAPRIRSCSAPIASSRKA